MKTVSYDLNIYPLEIIRGAILDYRHLCTIDLSVEGDLAVLSFFKCLYDEDITINEFSNYLIDLIGVNYGIQHDM